MSNFYSSKMLIRRFCKNCNMFLNTQAIQKMQMTSASAIGVSEENYQALKKLGFAECDYKKVLPKKRTIRELHLQKVVNMLTRLGFTHEEIRKQPNILWLHPFLIDHRYKLLEESGVKKSKITLERISKFPRLNTAVISKLKSIELINEDTDVVYNILSFSNLPLDFYPPKTSDDESLGNAQTTALQIFISWKLGFSREEVERKYQSYEDLHQKSIRLVMQSYDILVGRLEMPVNKIKQNIYLLEGHSDNFVEILDYLPRLGKSSILHIATVNPKILMRPLYKMLKVIDILKKYNITEDSIASYSNILTLSPDTVRKRVVALYADPSFNPFFCCPRICAVISRYNTSMSRYRLLSDLKWRCVSTSILTGVQQEFQKRIDMGHDENRGYDVAHYLRRHLGFGIKEIRKHLKVHPFFFLVPLAVVSDTTQHLLKSGFNQTDILKALPIVLYPKEKVLIWLQQVHSQPEVIDLLDDEGRIPSHLTLQLVLYYIERPFHFSGHGVWSKQDCSNVSFPQ